MAAITESQKNPVYVTISGLDAGHITLPDCFFVAGADPDVRTTVPSLSFLIQHPSAPPSRNGDVTNIIFDLGVKRDLSGYTVAQQPQVSDREPIITDPDCSASLRRGANNEGEDNNQLLSPEDIDFVILSHVHWDHVGTPSDFSSATFIVGSGTLDLLKNGAEPFNPAEEYNPDELPASRTVELPPSLDWDRSFDEYYAGPNVPVHTPTPANTQAKLPPSAHQWSWQQQSFAGFPRTIDFFGDQSVYVVDSPGHMYGHLNLLVRTAEKKYVYLGGDCCHDIRILNGDKEIAEYDDGRGGVRSIHVSTALAKKTLEDIRDGVRLLQGEDRGVEVEVVLAHDKCWRERNLHRFWPGKM